MKPLIIILYMKQKQDNLHK